MKELWYPGGRERILGEADHQEDGYSIEISIWDRFVLRRLYVIHLCGVSTRITGFWSLFTVIVLCIIDGVCIRVISR